MGDGAPAAVLAQRDRVPARVAGDGGGDDAAVEPADGAALHARGPPSGGREPGRRGVSGRLCGRLGRVRRGGVRGRRRRASGRRDVAWLGAHAWGAPAAALAGAGLFQFSGLKDRCLDQCRHPGPFLVRHYRRGPRGGFDLGRRHGLFCIGCCWALMALMLVMGARQPGVDGRARRGHVLRARRPPRAQAHPGGRRAPDRMGAPRRCASRMAPRRPRRCGIVTA